MFLDYLSLIILLLGLTLTFYAFIYIHDLPHKIAKKRHHPHEEAIHVACWLSLLTLHAMWPFVYHLGGHARKDGGRRREGEDGPVHRRRRRQRVGGDLGIRLAGWRSG